MTLSKAIQILEQHNGWREGYHKNMVDSTELTKALKLILETIKSMKYANV
jgi:hypothetical protein